MEPRKYQVKLTATTPTHIGGEKQRTVGIDLPVIKIKEHIVIPGSSLKGAFRAELERYLIEKYAGVDGMKPCIPAAKGSLSEMEKQLIRAGNFIGEGCAYIDKKKSEDTAKTIERFRDGDFAKNYICPACYLLGAQGIVGFVRVPYLFADEDAQKVTNLRWDRGKGTGAEGNNFSSEITPQETVFTGVLQVLIQESVRKWDLGKPRKFPKIEVNKKDIDVTRGDVWLADGKWNADKILQELIIERLQAIKLLGGFKSKGAGGVKITVTEVKETKPNSQAPNPK
jgi:CRISPR/Cas system CMR subunit Cmr4 (Cas7 group RAMP superfamily)